MPSNEIVTQKSQINNLNEFVFTYFRNNIETSKGYNVSCPAPGHGKGRGDKKPSLSISQKGDKILIKCHAGCDIENILQAAGLEKSDLFIKIKNSWQPQPAGKGKITAVYDYQDKDGNLLYQVVRYEPKDFRQRRPDGEGGYIWSLGEIERIPYKLPELLETISACKPVYIVEGEKDVKALEGIGMKATCNSGGAGKWTEAQSKYIPGGSEVVILPDNDKAGRDHADKIARELFEKDCKIKVVYMPDGAKDPAEWIENKDGTIEKLEKLIKDTPEYEPEKQIKDPEENHDRQPWDVEYYAELLKKKYYIHKARGGLYVYNGGYYIESNRSHLGALLKTELNARGEKCKTEYYQKIEDMIKSLVVFDEKRPQKNINLIPFKNGVLDIETMELKPHDPGNIFYWQIPHDYQDISTQERRQSRTANFLKELASDQQGNYNEGMHNLLIQIMGYPLLHWKPGIKFFILVGDGRNGKSKYIEMINNLLGEENTYSSNLQSLSTNRFITHELVDKLLNASADIPETRIMDSGTVKAITGGDHITVERKYKDPYTSKINCKLVFSCNAVPFISDLSPAMQRRLQVIAFKNCFTGEKEDKNISKKLQKPEEITAQINIMLLGLQSLLENNEEFITDPASEEITKEYWKEADVIGNFLEEKCRINKESWEKVDTIYEAFKEWLDKNGHHRMTKARLTKELHHKDIRKEQKRQGESRLYVYAGVCLLQQI